MEASTAARDAAIRGAGERGAAEGRALVERRAPLADGLAEAGYMPFTDETGAIILGNCPFHAVVGEHRDLVCSMNLAPLGSLAEAAGDERTARLDPAEGRCCVVFDPVDRPD